MSTLTREITFLDLTSGRERTGQWWSGAPLVAGRDAVWVVAYDTGRSVHIHRVAARHQDTRRALAGRTAPEYVTGVTTPYGTRHDLTRPGA